MRKYILTAIAILIACVMVVGGVTVYFEKPQVQNPSQHSTAKIIDGIPTLRIGLANSVEAAPSLDYVVAGNADDEAQAALNALPITGGRLEFMAGTYTFGATVSRAIPNVMITGQGKSTIFNYNASTPLFSAGSQSGWIFRDFVTDAGGITVSSATNYRLDDVTIGTTYYPMSVRTSTIVIAASDATMSEKSQADFVCTGTADQIIINAAEAYIAGLQSWNGFGNIVFSSGHFFTTNTIFKYPKISWQGTGTYGTTITFWNGSAATEPYPLIAWHNASQINTGVTISGFTFAGYNSAPGTLVDLHQSEGGTNNVYSNLVISNSEPNSSHLALDLSGQETAITYNVYATGTNATAAQYKNFETGGNIVDYNGFYAGAELQCQTAQLYGTQFDPESASAPYLQIYNLSSDPSNYSLYNAYFDATSAAPPIQVYSTSGSGQAVSIQLGGWVGCLNPPQLLKDDTVGGIPIVLTFEDAVISNQAGSPVAFPLCNSFTNLTVNAYNRFKNANAYGLITYTPVNQVMQATGSPLYYNNWNNTTGITAVATGSGVTTPGISHLSINTGASNGSVSSEYWTSGTVYAASNSPSAFTVRISIRTSMTNAAVWIGLFATPTAPTTTQNHIGFKIISGTLYATNGNGSTETSTSLGAVSQYDTRDLTFYQDSSGIHYYSGQQLLATQTTNLPSASMTPLFYITNTSGVGCEIWLYPVQISGVG